MNSNPNFTSIGTTPGGRGRAVTDADAVIGARIREMRTARGLSQNRLAKALGLSFQQVQKYETGANRVSVTRLIQIAEYFDVPTLFFLDDLQDRGARQRIDDPAYVQALRLAGKIVRLPQDQREALNGLVSVMTTDRD